MREMFAVPGLSKRSMSERFRPQERDTRLVPHPYRYTFRGEPTSLTFPPLCPRCGATASTHIACAKVFARTYSDSPTTYVTTTVLVPFCGDCAREHTAQAPTYSWWADLVSSFSTELMGAVAWAFGAVFFVYLGAKQVLRRDLLEAAMMFGIAALIGWSARGMQRIAWRDLQYRRVPPQTDLTSAFDFSDDLSSVFESARFACTVRDARFAEALAQLNADRLWAASSPEVQIEQRSARRKLWVAFAAFVLLALLLSLFTD